MYEIFTANTKTEKILFLHGRLNGKGACWLGSNIRIIYSIDDKEKIIIIEAIGTHKIY